MVGASVRGKIFRTLNYWLGVLRHDDICKEKLEFDKSLPQ